MPTLIFDNALATGLKAVFTMIKGSIVAIVTPMLEDGSLDLVAFRALLDFHIAQGTDGIVVVGTTGESPTVDVEEHETLIQIAVEHVAGRIPVIAGRARIPPKRPLNWRNFQRRREPMLRLP